MPPMPDERMVVGMTAPSMTATLAAVMPARIARIEAAEGSTVPEGNLVVALADGVQAARTEIARIGAQSTLEIELAKARWEHAQREWDRLAELHGDEHASSKELSDALAGARTARLEYEISLFNHDQAGRTYERERCILDEHQVRAPFTGYVAEYLKQAGETVDQLEGIVRLVRLDPLHVTVDCPVGLAPFLKAGDRYDIRAADPRWSPRVGTVVLVSRVADGGSQTFKVKLEVPNADQAWMAGLKVAVDFAAGATPDEGGESHHTDPGAVPRGDGRASETMDGVAP